MTNTQTVPTVENVIEQAAGRYTGDRVAQPLIRAAIEGVKAREGQIADNLRLLGTQLGASREDVEQALVDSGLVTVTAAAPDTASAIEAAVAKIQAAAEEAITSLRQQL